MKMRPLFAAALLLAPTMAAAQLPVGKLTVSAPASVIEIDVDVQFGVIAQQFGFADRLETQLVAGVRSIGNQLAQENLLVRIQRMGDQAQDLRDLGLEGTGFSDRAHAFLVKWIVDSGERRKHFAADKSR